MENNLHAGANVDKVIAVAVKKGKYSQLAVKWAVDNLAKEAQVLMLVHVRPKPTPFGQSGKRVNLGYHMVEAACGEGVTLAWEQTYAETLNMQAKEMFSPLISYCKRKNVQYEEVLIEDNDIVHGIADFALTKNVDVLIVGAGSRGGILKRLRGPENASKISSSAPYFCTVYTIGKGGVVSEKSASTSSQNLSSLNSVKIQEPEIGNHVRSIDSIMEPRISVSAGESLIQSKPVNEFEFRSPLQNNEDSDFSWGGHPPPDSDISFISSDKQCYDLLFSGYSTSSSDFSLGSFDSWEPSSLNNSSILSSARTSDASYSSQYTMDEMRRLQVELMQTKKMYEAARKEALSAKNLASKPTPQNLEDEWEMNTVEVPAMALAKLESRKDDTAAKIYSIKKRIAELQAQQAL